MVDYIVFKSFRAFVVEVMGRHCGSINGWYCRADIFIPERPYSEAGEWQNPKSGETQKKKEGENNTVLLRC